MKRTEKDIYDFVNRKLEEAKAQRLRQPFTSRESGELGAKIEAYHEVLNFIGTIRIDEKKLKEIVTNIKTTNKGKKLFFAKNTWNEKGE